MRVNNYYCEYSSTQKLIFYNKRNKKIIVNGNVNYDESIATVCLNIGMQLHGVLKMVRINNVDASIKEYQVIGFDRDQNIESNNDSKRHYVVYLSS